MSGTYVKASYVNIASTSYNKNSNGYKRLSGPELAEHIFNLDGLEPCGESMEKSSDYSDHLTDMTDGFEGYQFELKLENPNRLIEHYREGIRKYDRAYKKMANFALQWYMLQEDVNNNEQIEKCSRIFK